MTTPIIVISTEAKRSGETSVFALCQTPHKRVIPSLHKFVIPPSHKFVIPTGGEAVAEGSAFRPLTSAACAPSIPQLHRGMGGHRRNVDRSISLAQEFVIPNTFASANVIRATREPGDSTGLQARDSSRQKKWGFSPGPSSTRHNLTRPK